MDQSGEAIDRLFMPGSVALIGASRFSGSLSGQLLSGLVGSDYRGEIYLVNPHANDIGGVRSYHSIEEINQPVDVALIMLSWRAAIPALRQAAAIGAKVAIIYGSVPADLNEFNEQVMAVVEGSSIRVLGPNCLGVYNVDQQVPLTVNFPPHRRTPAEVVGVALVGQSAGALQSIASHGIELGVGFTHFASVGNEADLKFEDFLEYYVEHPHVRVVVAYVEQIRHPMRFVELAMRATARSKSIVLLQVGRSVRAKHIAQTHTGAIVGSIGHESGFMSELGVHVVSSINEAAAVASALRTQRPKPGGVGVLTIAGGLSTTIADLASDGDVALPELTPSTRASIDALLGSTDIQAPNVTNPVDLGTPGGLSARLWIDAFEVLMAEEAVSIGLVVTEPSHRDRASSAIDVARKAGKPIVFLLATRDDSSAPLLGPFVDLANHCVPVYTSDAECMSALAAMVRYSVRRDRPRFLATAGTISGKIERPWSELPKNAITEFMAKGWLESVGINVPKGHLMSAPEDEIASIGQLEFPVTLKVSDQRVSHKTDVGGVAVGIRSNDELVEAWRAMVKRLADHEVFAPTGFLIEEYFQHEGPEWLVGIHNDFGFGPLITVGTGGIQAEAIRDFVVAPAPVSPVFAQTMVESLRCWKQGAGRRGASHDDLLQLARLVAKVSELAWMSREWLAELDLNPVAIYRGQVIVLDARLAGKPSTRRV